jgi:hypothetical protein
MVDQVALGDAAKSPTVLMASIDDVKGRTVAYSRSNAYVSSTSRITSIAAVLLCGAVCGSASFDCCYAKYERETTGPRGSLIEKIGLYWR